MTGPVLHYTEGGLFAEALCEEPTGDSSGEFRQVTCVDCLDIIEALGVSE